jgi:hypothetical protein
MKRAGAGRRRPEGLDCQAERDAVDQQFGRMAAYRREARDAAGIADGTEARAVQVVGYHVVFTGERGREPGAHPAGAKDGYPHGQSRLSS